MYQKLHQKIKLLGMITIKQTGVPNRLQKFKWLIQHSLDIINLTNFLLFQQISLQVSDFHINSFFEPMILQRITSQPQIILELIRETWIFLPFITM